VKGANIRVQLVIIDVIDGKRGKKQSRISRDKGKEILYRSPRSKKRGTKETPSRNLEVK
jgi:hypothetical protein